MSATPASDSRCDVLFIPVSGPRGTGEYFRALTLAESLHDAEPACEIACCVHREASVPRAEFVKYYELGDSPTRETAFLTELLQRLRPRVVIFDSTSRQAQLACARRIGARVVYISSRAGNRNTGFQLRKMRHLDEHWIVTTPARQVPTWTERMKMRLIGRPPKVRYVTTILHTPNGGRRHASLRSLGLSEERPYALFAPGGGGGLLDGHPVAATFQQAAQQFADHTGMQTLFIAGPLAESPSARHGSLIAIHSVSSRNMADLIDGAELVVCGGGTLLLQAYQCGRKIVTAPAGSADQPARIRELASSSGQIKSSETSVQRLYEDALHMLRDAKPSSRAVANIGSTATAELVRALIDLVDFERP